MPPRRGTKWPARWPCTRWASCTRPTPSRRRSAWSRGAQGDGVLPGGPAGLPPEPHGRQRPGRAAGAGGRLARRAGQFEHSLSIHGQSTGWQNLAVVYRQLGQHDLARRAVSQAAAREHRGRRRPAAVGRRAQSIRWVDPRRLPNRRADVPAVPPVQATCTPRAGQPAAGKASHGAGADGCPAGGPSDGLGIATYEELSQP